MQVSAATKAQITLNEKKANLQKVLETISTQSGYDFVYSTSDLKNLKVNNIQLNDVTIEMALDACFNGQPLQYEIADKTVMVRRKEEKGLISEVKEFINAINIHGRVVDETGKSLPGVTVKIKDGNKATITNSNGEFSFMNISENTTIVFSFIGYQTKELPAQTDMGVVQLQISNSKLDEIQVIAYGQTSRRLNTGNTATVKAEDIATQPVANPLLALSGRVPGLVITQNSGVSGGGVTVRIQGQNSIIKGSDPFYVIDGVPYISQLLPSQNSILGGSSDRIYGANGNPLNYINPNDIESIDILKDADATAIYGSRAANGAILITTKKGKAGKTKVDATLQSGWGKATRMMNLLNTQEYLDLRHDAMRLDGTTPSPFDYDINGTWDTTRYTNWQKELIGRTAKYTDAQLNISGGSETTQFLVGGNFHRETSVFPGDFSDIKGGLHFTLNHQSTNKRFILQLTGNYLSDDNKLLQANLTDLAIRLAPDAPNPLNPDGSLNWAPDVSGTGTFYENPYSQLFQTFNSNVNNILGNTLISYRLLNGLSLKANLGYSRLTQEDFTGVPQISFDPSLWPILGNDLRTASYVNNVISSWIFEPQLDYHFLIGKGKLDALLGGTFTQQDSKGQKIDGRGYNSDLVLKNIQAASSLKVVGSIQSLYKYQAAFARLNYNWDDKYLLSGSIRRDGSSRFGAENRFHNFWSIAGAWIFSNHNFIIQNLPWISFGKLRASYGTTGNDQIGDYQYLSLYNNFPVSVPYLGVTGIYPSGLANPYIQWEETKKLQAGIDIGFLKDRIYLSANWFKNRSSNQLLGYSIPSTTGFTAIPSNFPALVQNSGWEFSMSTINVKNDNFQWSTNINLTLPDNKLVSFPNLSTSAYNDLVIGKSLNIVKAYQFAGVDSQTGQYQFVAHDGKITSSPDFETDRTQIIDLQPKIYGGLQNTWSYKGIALTALFQFARQTAKNYYFGLYPGTMFNQPVYVLNRWKQSGDMATHQRANSDFTYADQFDKANGSDVAYSDASYIRLKNISLSWSLPQRLYKMAGIEQIRLFTNGQNLLTFTKYKGIDPENASITSLPPLRVWTFGLQLTL